MQHGTILFGIGSCFTVFGMILLFMWHNIFEKQLQRTMALKEDSITYNIWRETPKDIPIYTSIYMFNITNVDDMMSGDGNVRPRVEELGPYVFRETITKENVTWYSNDTISYYNKKSWIFEADKTNGSLSDIITSVNPTIASIANMMRYESLFTKIGVDFGLSMLHKHQFLTADVASWLFNGIEDPIMEAAYNFPFISFDLPTRIGWFYGRNNSKSYEGEYLMNTGSEDFTKIGQIQRWRRSNRTAYRLNCGRVSGNAGEFWKLEIGQKKIEFFAPDICTSLTLRKQAQVNIEGVNALLFSSGRTLFDNGRDNLKIPCYCNGIDDCFPDGALNASLCYKGAPVFVSSPHFFGADPFYSSKVVGLNPTPTEEYAFQLTIDPLTGMTLMVKAQVQINLLIRRVDNILINNNLPEDTVLPMFWTKQELSVTKKHLALIKRANDIRYGVPYALAFIIVIGGIMCTAVVISARRKMAVADSKQILEDNSHYIYFPDKY